MSVKKKIFLGIVLVLVVIQFIHPSKNEGKAYTANDITHVTKLPAEVKNILEVSCYDCHSDHTNHMWYENIQPFGWWINYHISEGRQELNFSQFATYSLKRQAHKLEEVAETVERQEMPISSYTLVHTAAKLTDVQRQLLIKWATDSKSSLEARK